MIGARDWAISIDAGAAVTLNPTTATETSTTFRLQATGREIVLRFRPRFYQKHRGLKYFRPWTYQPWNRSVTGWTSWYAFRDKVTQKDIAETAAVIAETLAPFGYEYVQIDDGFQQDPIGVPDHWLKTNDKFPGGLEGLRASITSRGLKPGLWTNVSFAEDEFALAHPEYFVPGPDGRPAQRQLGRLRHGRIESEDARRPRDAGVPRRSSTRAGSTSRSMPCGI